MINSRIERYLPNLSVAFFWFLDGLAVYRTLGQKPPSGRRRVVLDQDTVDDSLSLRRNDVLVIPSKDWLSFEMTVPRISVKEQKEVVALEMADRTPFQPGETFFDWTGTPGGTCTVNMVRHDLINMVKQRHSSSHAFPRWLVCGNGRGDQFIDLAPKAKSALQLAMIATIAIALFLVVVGGVSLAETHGLRNQAKVRQKSISVAAAQNDEYRASLNYVDEHLILPDATRRNTYSNKGRLSILRLLEELTKATPDHSFLLKLDVVGTDISVTAISEHPEDLLRSIEDSPNFKGARILGTVSVENDKFSVQVGFEIEAKPK